MAPLRSCTRRRAGSGERVSLTPSITSPAVSCVTLRKVGVYEVRQAAERPGSVVRTPDGNCLNGSRSGSISVAPRLRWKDVGQSHMHLRRLIVFLAFLLTLPLFAQNTELVFFASHALFIKDSAPHAT